MSASPTSIVAWGGDPARKQASIEAARAVLAAEPAVTYSASLKLASTGQAHYPSNVYCAAYGTADPDELEARAGLSASTLLLASAALGACEYWGWSSESDGRVLRRAGVAVHGQRRLEWMSAESYYFYDPGDNLAEFWSPDPEENPTPGRGGTVRG